MGVGQLLSDTFGIVRSRFAPLLALWAIFFGITIALFFVFAVIVGLAGTASLAAMSGDAAISAEGAMAGGAAMVLAMIVLYIGYLLVAMAQYASLIAMSAPADRPSVGDAFGTGWRAAPALLLLMIVLIAGYLLLALVFSLLNALTGGMGDADSLVGALLLLPLIWIGCRLAPLFAVVAVDRVRNPFAAIARSWRLTRGHALTIFLASLAFLILLVIVCGVALLPSIGVLRSMGDVAEAEAAAPALGGLALFALGLLAVSILVTVLYSAFMAVIHGTLVSVAGEGAAETFA